MRPKSTLPILSAVFLLFQTLPTPCPAAVQANDWEKHLVAAPEVVFPAFFLRTGKEGSGTFVLIINPKNGEVTEVKVIKKRGDSQVIGLFVLNFFEWRFRPGTIKSATISRGANVYGTSRGFHSGR